MQGYTKIKDGRPWYEEFIVGKGIFYHVSYDSDEIYTELRVEDGHVHNTFDEYLLNDFIQRTRDYKRFERDKEYHYIPCNMINCFCQFSDYVPLSLDEWIALDKNRRRNMDIEDMIKTGQALDIDVSFGHGFMKVTLPTEKYYRLKDAFAEHGLTVEEGLRQFVEWTVNKPDEFKAWVEECKKEGYFSEAEIKAWT